jgi:hypothetical protein
MFNNRLSFGQEGQDLLINFLERHMGYKFIAGERHGLIENMDFVEEIEGCQFIPPDNFCGAKLKFSFRDGSSDMVTMPDVFMEKTKEEKFYWVEVKRHQENSEEIIIDKDNFEDYKRLLKYTRHGFYVMCINPTQNGCSDVYYCNIFDLIESEPEHKKIRKNSVYVWNMKKVMKKLNMYAIEFNKYY